MANGWSLSNFCVAGLQYICVLELIWLVTGAGLITVLLVYRYLCIPVSAGANMANSWSRSH